MKKYYKSHSISETISDEEGKTLMKEVYKTLTKHRSAKSRKAEKFIIDNIDDIVIQFGAEGLRTLKGLYSFRVNRRATEYLEFRGEGIKDDLGDDIVPKFENCLTYEEYMTADMKFIRSKL